MSENNRREKAEAICKEKGLVLLDAITYELQVDIDSARGLLDYDRAMDIIMKDDFPVKIVDTIETVSANGNKHIYLWFEGPLTFSECLFLQSSMGSDNVRELLSYRRWRDGIETPTLLFETPTEASRVKQWRERMHKIMETKLMHASSASHADREIYTDDDVPF